MLYNKYRMACHLFFALQCICCVSRWPVILQGQDDMSSALCYAMCFLCQQVIIMLYDDDRMTCHLYFAMQLFCHQVTCYMICQVTCHMTLTGWCVTCSLQCICCVRWHVVWHWQDDMSPVLCSAVQLLCWQVTCHMTRTGWCVTSTPWVWWPCCAHPSHPNEHRCWSSRSSLHPASPQQVQIFGSLRISFFLLFFFLHILSFCMHCPVVLPMKKVFGAQNWGGGNAS